MLEGKSRTQSKSIIVLLWVVPEELVMFVGVVFVVVFLTIISLSSSSCAIGHWAAIP